MIAFEELQQREVTFENEERASGRHLPAPTVTAEAHPQLSRSILVSAVLAHSGEQPVEVLLKGAGYSSHSPLEAYVETSEQIRPIIAAASGPSIWPRFFAVTVPAKCLVRVSHVVSLHEYEYSGEPEAAVKWRLCYADGTEQLGTIRVKLPRQDPTWPRPIPEPSR